MLGGIVFQLCIPFRIFNVGRTNPLTLEILHLVSLSVFCILVAEYLVRYSNDRPARPLLLNNSSSESLGEQFQRPALDTSAKLLLIGLFFESLFLYIRFVHNQPISDRQTLMEMTAQFYLPYHRTV